MGKLQFIIFVCVIALLAGCSGKRIPEASSLLLDVFPPDFQKVGPTAKANIKYRQVTVGERFTFDATNSVSRAVPTRLSYQWQIKQKPAESQTEFSSPESMQSDLIVDVEGLYLIQLSVTDSQGQSDHFDIALSSQAEDLKQSRFIAMANFGTGSNDQSRLAEAVAGLCEEKSCDFIIGLGNNISPKGIAGKDDDLLQDNFDDPFAALKLPFYLVLGNQDTIGLGDHDGILNLFGDAQVDLSRWRRKPTFRWQMPARYYRISTPIEDLDRQPLADMYALDTTLLIHSLDKLSPYKLQRSYKKQGDWLANQQSQSHAQWQIAFAHHSYLSNGKHGDAGRYDYKDIWGGSELVKRVSGKYVKQFIEEHVCDKVDLYLSAHDNNLQYLEPNSRCGKTEFIVSGAGVKTASINESANNPAYWQLGDTQGFFHIEMIAERMTVSAYIVNSATGLAEKRYSRTLYR